MIPDVSTALILSHLRLMTPKLVTIPPDHA